MTLTRSTLNGFQGGFAIPDGVKQGTQQETNYYLADVIAQGAAANQEEHADLLKLIAELDEHTIWFGAGPPEVVAEKYKFWWDTEALELLINYNDQWFPVSIPPAQVETLRATIDGIMDDVTRVKADIVLNKADIDLVAAESAAAGFVKNRILTKPTLRLWSISVPSSDEF